MNDPWQPGGRLGSFGASKPNGETVSTLFGYLLGNVSESNLEDTCHVRNSTILADPHCLSSFCSQHLLNLLHLRCYTSCHFSAGPGPCNSSLLMTPMSNAYVPAISGRRSTSSRISASLSNSNCVPGCILRRRLKMSDRKPSHAYSRRCRPESSASPIASARLSTRCATTSCSSITGLPPGPAPW